MTFGVDNDFYNRQFTQELRLTSDYVNSPVNFMVGGFYQDGYMTNRLNLRGNEDLRLPEMLQSALHEIDIRSFSAFGQAMWDVTPQWEIAAGARWTDEKRDHVEFNFNPGSGPLGQVFGPDPQLKSANVSPEVSVTYKPTDDSTVFGSYKEGFKSGSFNSVQFVPSSAKDSFGDEKVRGGEMGIKARLFDRTVTLNLAGYFYHYTDLQVGTSERNADGTFAIRTLNAASANVHGVDFDMSYAPPQVEGLALHTAVNWNRARYGEFNNAPCGGGQTISEGCNRVFDPTPSLTYPAGHFVGQDLSGAHLVRAPEWTAVVGMDYEMPVGRAMRLTLGTGVNYTSKYLTTLIDNPDYYQHDYAKVSANIALRGANDAWEVALIGNNLNNEITTASCVNADSQNGTVFGGQLSGVATKGVAGSDELTCIAERGREIWVRFTFRPMELLRR
jgi:iron complex outermembrane receptor protein